MKLLVIGSGGREHALAWKLAQSANVDTVFVAPGNAGTALENGLENVAIDVMDIDGLASFAKEQQVAFTVVGPEAPLVAGIVDQFRSQGLPCFGPEKAAAQLEGSKAFTKAFLQRHQIPTAAYQAFTDVDEALSYVRQQGAPIVIKADGLAAGKGVIVAETLEEAEGAVRDMLDGNRFGDAGHRVVIEECLFGEEASFIVMANGTQVLPLATSQDHKRAHEGDTGPNTGGMGAYSPAPVVTDDVYARVMNDIIKPTLAGMVADGTPYTGFLYAGLMIDDQGNPKVIEFNCRFGDPETQPILMRLQSDFASLIQSALDAQLDNTTIEWDARPALGVVMAAGGYPLQYEKGNAISGINEANTNNTKVFHAGTKLEGERIVTNGGRVLCVTALGDTLQQAQNAAYAGCQKISWDQAFYRNDIGHRAL